MAALGRRILFVVSHRRISTTANKFADKMMPDPLEHATGLEKRELLALQSGNEDPFYLNVIKRAPNSTKQKPNLVPSVFDSRIIGCICEEDQTHVNWMWVYEGEPSRCGCGNWFKLDKKTPI